LFPTKYQKSIFWLVSTLRRSDKFPEMILFPDQKFSSNNLKNHSNVEQNIVIRDLTIKELIARFTNNTNIN
jgi:hypothetical protein